MDTRQSAEDFFSTKLGKLTYGLIVFPALAVLVATSIFVVIAFVAGISDEGTRQACSSWSSSTDVSQVNEISYTASCRQELSAQVFGVIEGPIGALMQIGGILGALVLMFMRKTKFRYMLMAVFLLLASFAFVLRSLTSFPCHHYHHHQIDSYQAL